MALIRYRMPVIVAAILVIVVATAVRLAEPPAPIGDVATGLTFAAVIALVAGFGMGRLAPTLIRERPAVRVLSPVRGRWLAMNSPATKVPSHGVRSYGQAHAIDLVAEPEGAERPTFGEGAAFLEPAVFPAFGAPVHAMVTGTVVSASHRHRDHRSRSTYPGLLYLAIAASGRAVGGPGFVVGNHVTITTDEGVFALVAHLKRDSLTVEVGDRVEAGQAIAQCGNTGNSSEPHVHAQLMDRRSLWTAQGVPMAFASISVDGASPADTLPADNQHMVAI